MHPAGHTHITSACPNLKRADSDAEKWTTTSAPARKLVCIRKVYFVGKRSAVFDRGKVEVRASRHLTSGAVAAFESNSHQVFGAGLFNSLLRVGAKITWGFGGSATGSDARRDEGASPQWAVTEEQRRR